jgi:oxygen-dependent protoporphyrinogen oxidase
MRVLVVGGGITGLSCAYDLQAALAARRPCCAGAASAAAAQRGGALGFSLLESSGRLGGKLAGDSIEGVPVDAGPDSFLSTRPAAVELLTELGLRGQLLTTDRGRRDVFVFSRGKLRRYPDGLMMLMPAKVIPFLASDLLSFPEKLRMGLEFFLPPLREEKDESLAEFGRRRFGEAAVRTILEPVFAGIYAGDVETLSLNSTFPQFRDIERKYGSVLRGVYAGKDAARKAAPEGLTMFVTLKGGVSRLVETLADRVRGAARLDSRVESIRREGGVWRVSAGGAALEADAVVLAAPADAAAAMLEQAAPGVSSVLRRFEFSSTAAVNLLYETSALKRRPEGFGFLVQRGEGVSLTAATFTSNKFPGRAPEGKTLLRCYFGGSGREAPLALDDEGLLRAALADLERILGLGCKPLGSRVHRWPQANALYNVGHAARLADLEEKLPAFPGLLLAGGCYRGIGIPECVRSGREAARRVLQAQGVPQGAVV